MIKYVMTENCSFCSITDKIQLSSDSAISIFDKYPVTKHHSLIIPKRHWLLFLI